jgi:hypothetical protein
MTMQCQMSVMKQAVETVPFEKLNLMYGTLSYAELRGMYKAFMAIAHDTAAYWQLGNMPLFHTQEKVLVLNTHVISDQHFIGSACQPQQHTSCKPI